MKLRWLVKVRHSGSEGGGSFDSKTMKASDKGIDIYSAGSFSWFVFPKNKDAMSFRKNLLRQKEGGTFVTQGVNISGITQDDEVLREKAMNFENQAFWSRLMR